MCLVIVILKAKSDHKTALFHPASTLPSPSRPPSSPSTPSSCPRRSVGEWLSRKYLRLYPRLLSTNEAIPEPVSANEEGIGNGPPLYRV